MLKNQQIKYAQLILAEGSLGESPQSPNLICGPPRAEKVGHLIGILSIRGLKVIYGNRIQIG